MGRFRRFLKQSGQTAVEYVMVTAVSISLGVTFTRRVSDLLVDNPNSFIGAYITRYKQILNTQNGNRPFNRFRMQR